MGLPPETDKSLLESASVYDVRFSQDGLRLLTGTIEGNSDYAKIWDMKSGKLLKNFAKGHRKGIESVSFSPDESKILTASKDETAILWDISSEKQLHKLIGHSDYIHSATFSPNGLSIITSSEDKTLRIWDVKTGEELNKIEESEKIYSIALFPDGKHIAAGLFNGEIHIWNIDKRKIIKVINGGQKESVVNSIAISGDGSMILNNSRKGAQIWDVSDLDH